MAKNQIIHNAEELRDTIIESLIDKKAEHPVSLFLKKTPNSITEYFIICHGTSNIHVESIADYVLENVRKNISEKPWQKEGFENAEWILLDYVNVVVHIFQEDKREFYNLEELWADVERKEY